MRYLLIGGIVIAAGLGGWWWLGGAENAGTADTTVVERSFTEVVLSDLVDTVSYDGVVGRVAGNPILTRRSGTVTAVPDAGTLVGFGDVLVWIDAEPVILLEGTIPAYRPMRRNTEGPDVLQLETALAALGFGEGIDLTIDDSFTAATGDVVGEWQEAVGLAVDEIVGLGDVVFLGEPFRISDVLVTVGQTVRDGEPVLATSSDELLVSFGLPAADQGLVEVGDAVTIELPDGSETNGVVTAVASTVTRNQDGSNSFEVAVAPGDSHAIAGFEDAPVEVRVVSQSVENVMVVPVTALLALSEGGYAVEVDAGGGFVRLVGVDPGFFAGGLVEITADGIAPGDRVVVP